MAPSADAQVAPAGPPIQLVQPVGPAAPPAVVTLKDALERAKQNDAQFQTVATDAQVAAGDRAQAKAARLPSVGFLTQYLGTQGNGTTPNGRFVTNDGVHVYRSWLAVHQDLSPNTLAGTGHQRAQAAEAVAKARVEVAERGLAVTVTRTFYALITAQRRYATAQLAAQQSARFLDYSQQQERLGQVAHSDVIKAQIQMLQQRQGFQEATLAIETARLDLAVLLSPTLDENFTVVDDLDQAPALPPFSEVQMRAERENPDLRVANQTLRMANLDVRAAKNGFLPTLSFDGVYGIEANAFALNSVAAAFPEKGPLPNLGYFFTGSLSIPIWDWGSLRSKLGQAEAKQRQSSLELTQAQRQLVKNLYSSYNEALAARSAADDLRQTADLSDESLRLMALRYQAGESTVLEVVDAQNTMVQARAAYADALVRYRVALATIQTLTGSF
jgi:outer membrane protein TolC